MRYVISYDLMQSSTNDDYERLHEHLERIGAQRVLFSQWIVRWNKTSPQQVFNYVRRVIKQQDRLLVTELDGSGWWGVNLMVDIKSV